MGDSPGPSSPNFYKILGISKNSSLKDISKAYKSLVMKWHPDKHSTNKVEAEAKFRDINEAYRALTNKKREEELKHETDPSTPTGLGQAKSPDESFFSRLRSRTPTRLPTFSRDTMSRGRSTTPTPTRPNPTPPPVAEAAAALSKTASKRTPTPIIYSGSTAARRKAPAVERKLLCTLEELCNGCVKNIRITRDALSDFGLIVQQEEILKVRIKPGWKKGTKITFEGKGDERPGFLPADIIFIIAEKRHPIFKREGDDLELGVEIPLLEALTGCTLSVPILGGDKMTLSFDDIIYPGFEKLIPGQGMPKPKEQGKRGNLRLNFFINFPTDLSDDQRSEIVSILGDTS